MYSEINSRMALRSERLRLRSFRKQGGTRQIYPDFGKLAWLGFDLG